MSRKTGSPVSAGPATSVSGLQAVANASQTIQPLATLQRLANTSASARQSANVAGDGVPHDLRSGIETLSGVSLDGVKVHRNSPRPAQLRAHAYAQGRDIHIAPGQERHLPHEAWHVVQQAKGRVRATTSEQGQPINDNPGLEHEADQMGARALSHKAAATPSNALQRVPRQRMPVQRVYAGLDRMGKARVDQQADVDYAQKALAFELGMAPLIMTNPAVNMAIDGILLNIKNIVDAWAVHTSQEQAAVYEHEFGWPPGDGYYGAFEMTAENITALFADTNKPLRTKLKLIYNAVRNNALSKWLKVAALQLDKKARGKSGQTIKVRSEGVSVDRSGDTEKRVSRSKNETVTKGFAESSGIEALHNPAETGDLINIAKAKKERTRKRTGVTRRKRDMFDHKTMSNVVGWKPATHKAHGERFHDPRAAVSEDKQRHLTVGDVPDLTDEEIDLMIKRRGLAENITSGSRTMFRQGGTANLSWGQGREHYDINLDSDSAKEAAQIKARMEAGISGSTDLMMHAAEHLGVKNSVQKMSLRLGLAGWMIAARDHSFYEVFKAAEAYGVPFHVDPTRPGAEYEHMMNLSPMTRVNFAGILPNDGPLVNVFPADYFSVAWKDHLENTVLNANQSEAAAKGALVASGVNKLSLSAMNERDTVAMQRLEQVVRTRQIDASVAGSERRQAVRRIKEDPSYLYLANTFGAERARRTLSDLLAHHHVAAVLSDQGARARLRDAGLPDVVIDFAKPEEILHLDRVRRDISAVAPPAAGPISPAPFVQALTVTTPVTSLDVPRVNMVVAALIRHYHPNAPEAPLSSIAADKMNRIREVEQIINMETTTGTWYSWGPPGSHDIHAAAPSLREATAISNTSSLQGPGLYVASSIIGSITYGDFTGARVLVVNMTNVPTINQLNRAQRDRLDRLIGYDNGPLKQSGLYDHKIRSEFLMRYGSGGFARLSTNKGVNMTMDLKTAPQDVLKQQFQRLDRWPAKARANFIEQARESKLDISKW
ncbi:hypothetical protein ROLI_027530 [Roseobacter fucihabitans]|uniref:eCIS core domain-containing protein n=1 Tax=Roseobacter fucihabitans TaxID=1537242 RepID=A0ABZ2BWB1_9RHOB|nr:DUF4157 domain-containing protein [Roseobacter litoralis]MBC6966126.1 hypothetical protein [Roseobacter litoralis]